MTDISIQFYNLQLDKLIICKKELLYMQELTFFYRANNEDFYSNKFNSIYENIKHLLRESISLITNEIEKNHKLYQTQPFVYLTHYALTEKNIELLVIQIKYLSMKITQNTEEYFDQYIPKALMGRRYNNKVITHFFEDYFHSILQKYTQPDDDITNQEPIIVWNFNNNYTVNQSTLEEPHSIINNAFWYYEIPRLIPNLVHEIGHLCNKTNSFKSFKKDILEEKDDFNIGLIEEVYGDLIAIEELGASYILSLFYTISYNDFHNLFYNNIHRINIIPYFTREGVTQIILEKIQNSYIRLYVLIEAILHKEEGNVPSFLIKHMKDLQIFINNYFTIFDTGQNTQEPLELIYKKHYPEHYEDYIQFCNEIKDFGQIILTHVDKIPTKDSDVKIDYQEIFNAKWDKRLKNKVNESIWYHKNDIRKDLLKNIFKNKKLNSSFDAYELILYKTRFDTTLQKSFQSNIFCEDVILENKKLFGLFNYFELKKKNEKIEYSVITENFLKVNESNNSHSYYSIRYPLTFINIHNKNSQCNLPFGLILQLQLKDMNSESIVSAYNILSNKSFSTKCASAKYTVYKSLGPNDYILIFESIALDTIFELKEYLSSKTIFRRTSSIIYRNDADNKSYAQEHYLVYSKIRLKCPINTFKDLLKEFSNKIASIYHTPGSTDVTIVWKDTPSKKFYSSIYPCIIDILKNNISDIQTYIDKKVQLNNENNND